MPAPSACVRCSAPITQAARGRPRLYCSARCKKAGRDRSLEYARRAASRPSRAVPPVPPLFPQLEHGRLASRYEELNRDLRQEAALAELEGRDVRAAVRSYRWREREWLRQARWLPPEL